MSLPLPAIEARIGMVRPFSFPGSLAKIGQLVQDGTPIPVVAAVVATDPALSASVIGQANAAASSQVLALTPAIMDIGVGALLGLAHDAEPIPDSHRKAMASCWSQANAVAAMLTLLVDQRPRALAARPEPDALQVIGLVHDLGHAIAVLHFTREYSRACIRLQGGEGPFDVLVKEEIGASCGELGQMLAQAWSLPPLLAAVMRHHRQPMATDDLRTLCCLVHIAHQLTAACGFTAAGDRYLDLIDEGAMATLGLSTVDLQRVLERFSEQLGELELYEGVFNRR